MTGRTVLAIRHVHFEDLGIFASGFTDAGFGIRYLDAGVDDLSGIDATSADIVAVLGAPIGAYEENIYPFLRDELRIIEQRIAAQRPTLGICLGAQLMARALGAKVYPGAAKEIGWSRLTLTDEGRNGPLKHFDQEPVLHWHGDTFTLPNGAVRLASTPITENQAFAFGPAALALQFHAEANPQSFERWLIGHACEIAATPGISAPQLRATTRELGAACAARGRACLAQWLAGIPAPAAR